MAEPTSYSNEQIAKAKEAILNGEELNEQLLKIINSEKQLRDLLNQTRKSEEQIASERAKYHEKRLAELNLETKAMATLSNEALRAADGFQDLYTKQQRESQIAVEKASIAVEQQKEKIKQLEKEGATHSDIKKQLEELAKLQKDLLKTKQENKKLEDEIAAGVDGFTTAINLLGIKTHEQQLTLTESFGAGAINYEVMAKKFEEFTGSSMAFRNIMASFGAKFIESTIAMAKALDGLRAEMFKATGGSNELTYSFMRLAETSGDTGTSFKEMNESISGLLQTSSNFTEMTNSQRESVARNNAQLIAMGVSAQTAGKNFSIFSQSLGMTAEQSNASSRELASLAKNLNMSLSEVSDGFGQAATTVVAYGQGAVREFSRLAAESKALGLSVQELINIVKGADTFQGAAEQAGKLNAMLGGGLLNSSQLLVASESERIQLIRDAVMQTGRSFSTMSKYEQIAIANAAGIQDLTVAQKLFNNEINGGELDRYLGKTNVLGMSQEEMEKQAIAAKDTQEKLNVIMEQFAAIMSPVVTIFGKLLGLLVEYGTIIKIISVLTFAYMTLVNLENIIKARKFIINAIEMSWINAQIGAEIIQTAVTEAKIFTKLKDIATTIRGIAAKGLDKAAEWAGIAIDWLKVGSVTAKNAVMNSSLLIMARNLIAMGLQRAATIINIGITYAMAAAQWFLGAASQFAGGKLMLLVNVFLLLYNIFHMTGSPMLYLIFGFVAIGVFLLGQAAEKSQKGLYAFGAAMLMVGTGAFLAFHGLEGFATALAALDPTQLAALVATIIFLSLAMIAMFAIVIFAGSSAVGPMLALGVAFLLIGAGAYLAGLGLSLVVNAFANLATNMVALLLLPLFLQLMALGFIALTISIYMFGTALPVLITAIPLLFILAIALGSVGVSLGIIATAMLTAAMASVIFGVGLLLISKGLSSFTVEAAVGIAAVAVSLVFLKYALTAIGASMILFGGPILAAIAMIGLLAIAISSITPEKSIALKTTVDSIQDLSNTGKTITPETITNLDKVVDQIHKLNIEATISKAVNITAPFKELIDAINGQTAAAAGGKETTVVMKLNDREFGRAVVGVMNEYGTKNTSIRKPTPA